MENIYLDITGWNKWLKERFPNKDFIKLNDLISDYEDLITEAERLEELIHDIEQNIKDNYRRIPVAEQVGISDRDFI